jgi:hypothetical protein
MRPVVEEETQGAQVNETHDSENISDVLVRDHSSKHTSRSTHDPKATRTHSKQALQSVLHEMVIVERTAGRTGYLDRRLGWQWGNKVWDDGDMEVKEDLLLMEFSQRGMRLLSSSSLTVDDMAGSPKTRPSGLHRTAQTGVWWLGWEWVEVGGPAGQHHRPRHPQS